MRITVFFLLIAVLAAPFPAVAQGILEDILAGSLVAPEVGVYAVYELTDTATGQRLLLRQAVVGEERVRRRTAWWFEVEIIPELGYPVAYKTLLTGPASDPDNVHRLIIQEGDRAPVELPPEALGGDEETAPESVRNSVGMEVIVTPAGEIETERFVVYTEPEADARSEVWINESVRPLGIVRMVSPNGELMLRRYGKGGPDAVSAIRREAVSPDAPEARPQANVEVRVEGGVPQPAEPPEPPEPAETAEPEAAPEPPVEHPPGRIGP